MASLNRNVITAAHPSSGLIHGEEPTQLCDRLISTLTTIEECATCLRALHTCLDTRYEPYINTPFEAGGLEKLRYRIDQIHTQISGRRFFK